MLKRIEIEAKNSKEALKTAVEQLKVAKDRVVLEVIKEKKGLLGGISSATYLAYVKVDLALEGKEFLDGIMNALEVDAKLEFRTIGEHEINFRIEAKENALLIGRDGKTLVAIQTLLRTYLANFVDEPLQINLDIGNYHESRRKNLEIIATKTAKQVARSKIAVTLPPMNSFERRIIHAKLADWRDVETQSSGEAEMRAVTIKPRKKY